MDLSIVVVSWNTRELLARCLASITDTVKGTREVFVVDNASEDGSADWVSTHHPDIHLIRNRTNFGFARANNQAMRLARGRHVLLLNSDAQLLPGCADGLVAYLDAHPDYGAAACRLLNEDGTLQRSCRRFPTYATLLAAHTEFRYRTSGRRLLDRLHMRDWDHASDRDVDQPAAACLMIPRAVIDRVGLFDEGCFLLYNDVDLCRRIREADLRIAYRHSLRTVHTGSASLNRYSRLSEEGRRNVLHYIRKWHGPGLAGLFWIALGIDGLVSRIRPLLRTAKRAQDGTAVRP